MKLTRLQSLAFGYIITQLALFVTQWFSNYFGHKNFIWSFLVFSCLGLFALRDQNNFISSDENDIKLNKWLTLFWALQIILYFGLMFLLEIPAIEGVNKVTSVYQDQLWNLGNVWSIIRGKFPTIDSRFDRQVLGYHLLQSYLHASTTIVTGIHALFVQNYYFSILDGFFLIFTIGHGFKKFLNWNNNQIIIITFLLLFSKGIGWYYHIHLFANPLTFYHSLSAFLLFACSLINYFETKNKKLFPLIFISAMVMIGSKAILAFLFLSSLGLLWVLKLAFKRSKNELISELGLGIGLIAGCFALKSMIFLNSRPMLLNPGGDYSTVFKLIQTHLHFLSETTRKILFILYLTYKRFFYYFKNPQGIILLISISFLYLRGLLKKSINETTIFIFLSICICILYENAFRYDGSDAEIYYVWYGVWLVAILAGYFLHQAHKYLQKIAWTIIGIAILLGAINLFHDFYGYRSWDFWLSNESHEANEATVNYNEMQAMFWLKDNVSDNDIILSHRRSFPKLKSAPNGRIVTRFFAYSALSGKQFFIEGDSFNCCDDLARSNKNWTLLEQFLSETDIHKQVDFLKYTRANYFVQSLRFNRQNFSHIPILKIAYQNPDIIIYQIVK